MQSHVEILWCCYRKYKQVCLNLFIFLPFKLMGIQMFNLKTSWLNQHLAQAIEKEKSCRQEQRSFPRTAEPLLWSCYWFSSQYCGVVPGTTKFTIKLRELETLLRSSVFCLIKTPIIPFCDYRWTSFNSKGQLFW